ncbi:unnamed protein product [Rotaria sp. Silwood2]|nr:unnamed protein product [Rotaria sp. Silwood2]CAF4170969.1 unnamed protein product [Rotaria sp. Silwood2]CAF4257830.1 unnamed protein product [Rotaria sp. Silwood2]
MYRCSIIERKALSIIEKWRDYRMDKDLRYFAYYTALTLVKEGSNSPNLIEIIKKTLVINTKFHLKNIITDLFYVRPVNPTIFRQVFATLQQNIPYSSQIDVGIYSKEILELILSLELEQITSNIHHKNITKPYLLMTNYCSEHLEVYLRQYLLEFMQIENTLQHNIKEEHFAIIFKWIIEIWNLSSDQDLEVIVQLIDIFIVNLYNYLCNKENIDYLTDFMPNYVDIALQFCERNLHVSRSAIKNCSFGEEKFRKEYLLYFYQTNNLADRKILVQLYAAFDGITNELVEMD